MNFKYMIIDSKTKLNNIYTMINCYFIYTHINKIEWKSVGSTLIHLIIFFKIIIFKTMKFELF
jgi:hypothetical protein